MTVLRPSTRRRVSRAGRRSLVRLVALVVALGVALPALALASASPAKAAPDDGILKVLLFYKPNFHASNVEARAAIKELAAELGTQYDQDVEVQETDDPAAFTTENLATKDVLAFAQTGGVLFNESQRSALEAYIRGGGGFVGLHYTGWSVGQSEHDVNPFYLRLVGAMSEGHPENPGVRSGRITVNDPTHPLAAGLPAEITRNDEWYDWTVNPAPNVRTIAEADESSYQSLGRQGTNHPITWCQEIDAGRSWYTGLGHEGTAYSEPFIRQQLRNGLAYGAGLVTADCSPPSKEDHGGWSGVTPWPLMPINAALTADGKVQTFGAVSNATANCNDTTPYDWTGNGCIFQGGQMEFDVWDPAEPRTLANVNDGLHPNHTYTDLFCSMQVQDPNRRATLTVGGDDGLGENAPNDAAVGVTSYSQNRGMRNEAPMNYARWYPTGTTMPNGDIVVQGGSLRGGPGGPGVLTPEISTPDEGTGWKLLEGATSAEAYGDGVNGGPDENRWWYPRAFVAPGSGTLFNISGTQMFELDPYGNDGDGELTLRGTLPSNVANQGALGNPVGATSTAAMYRPGKILQVGGGWWANGGGPAGARGAFTVDITGGTTNPVVETTDPMEFQRHWPTATVLPDGDVLVTGGSRDNNGNGGYVTDAEVWDPDTGEWTTVAVPHEHARLYHSTALLLPDGRVMIGGGGAPGPRNYTDVEYYSPSYLFDGDEPATRPEITSAPKRIGYDGTFDLAVDSPIEKVTLVRNGSVTHGFNNDQNFQELEFTQDGDTLTVDAPQDSTYAPPGAYMVFVWTADGTPSVASITDLDPEVELDARTPQVVDQFEYPRIPADWRGGNPQQVVDVPVGGGRMSPWSVESPVQLVRAIADSQGANGDQGYHLGLGTSGVIERTLTGLDPGKSYRISLRHARDSRSAGTGDATASLEVGDLDASIVSTTANPSNGNGQTVRFASYVGSFTASARSETLRLSAPGSGAGTMIDDLVVISADPSAADVPVHYEFEEGEGTTAANTGTDSAVGPAVLTGTTGWSENGVLGGALELPGGGNENAADLPDNLLQGAADFTTSFWVRPDAKANWIGLFHIGDGLAGDGSFFQIQMQTDAAGPTGLAATFKAKGSSAQERIYAVPTQDVVAERWNHVAFTRTGSTGTLYLDGEPIASRDDLTIDMTDVGPTANNWLGRNGFPDPAYNGLMDDVRVYTSTLTDDDIAGLYEAGTALRTTTTVTVDPASPSPYEEPLTVSASVEGEDDAPAGGTAALWVDGDSVGEVVELADGEATFPELTLGPGAHEIEVRYAADDGWRDSTGTVTHTVSRPPPGEGTPIHYPFDEGTGTTAANVGTDSSIGPATLEGATTWTEDGQLDGGVSLPGGAAGTGNQVRLPNNITEGMDTEFSTSLWLRPDVLPNWVPHLQIGKNTTEFFLLQSSTENGARGFAATFRKDDGGQERLQLPGETDLPLNEWTHVVFTMFGGTGRIYFDGELVGERTDFTVDIGDVGEGGTTANLLGGTSWNDPRYDGLADDLRIYDYELTAEQVEELYSGEQPGGTAPVAVDDQYTTDEDEALTVDAPGVLANDTDAEDDDLTAGGLTQPAHGEVTLEDDGSFTYTPDDGYVGVDTFTYTANDGTSDSGPATVQVTVEEVEDPPGNDAPTAVADIYATDEDQPLVVEAPGVLGNDTDPDGDELTAIAVGRPADGDVTLNPDGSFTYTPDQDFSGEDTFVYKVNDGTVDSNLTTVTIAVDAAPPAVTAVVALASPFRYGQRGVVQAAVSPGTATGTVEVLDGTDVIGTGTVQDGKARIQLAVRSLPPGTHDLTLAYAGDSRHAASSSSVEVQVRKAAATWQVTAPRAVERGDRYTVTVRLTATGTPVTGIVRTTARGATITRSLQNGRASFAMPRATGTGPMTVRIAYAGSRYVEAATRTVTIRVAR